MSCEAKVGQVWKYKAPNGMVMRCTVAAVYDDGSVLMRQSFRGGKEFLYAPDTLKGEGWVLAKEMTDDVP